MINNHLLTTGKFSHFLTYFMDCIGQQPFLVFLGIRLMSFSRKRLSTGPTYISTTIMQSHIQYISVTKVRLKVNALSTTLSSHFESQIGDTYQKSTTSKPRLRKHCQKHVERTLKTRIKETFCVKSSSVYKVNKSLIKINTKVRNLMYFWPCIIV
jgi:hypothetical protein